MPAAEICSMMLAITACPELMPGSFDGIGARNEFGYHVFPLA
jgi:hypothetical protein